MMYAVFPYVRSRERRLGLSHAFAANADRRHHMVWRSYSGEYRRNFADRAASRREGSNEHAILRSRI